jgi:hypothetical protein
MHHIVVKRVVVLLIMLFIVAISLFAVIAGPVASGSF